MQFQIMALIGEFERGTIAQNVKMGMRAKAKAVEWIRDEGKDNKIIVSYFCRINDLWSNICFLCRW